MVHSADKKRITIEDFNPGNASDSRQLFALINEMAEKTTPSLVKLVGITNPSEIREIIDIYKSGILESVSKNLEKFKIARDAKTDEIIGFVSASKLEKDATIGINDCYVRPEYRRQKIGLKLMSSMAGEIINQKAKEGNGQVVLRVRGIYPGSSSEKMFKGLIEKNPQRKSLHVELECGAISFKGKEFPVNNARIKFRKPKKA
jgi:GNAT superfamily N-acetyltransferase